MGEAAEKAVYRSLFEHRYINDADDSTMPLPYGQESAKIERLLTEGDEPSDNFEIDDANEHEITVRVYEGVTNPETNENELSEETYTFRHIAVGFTVNSDEPVEEDRLILALDGAAFDLFTQLTHTPTNVAENIPWWLCRVGYYVGQLQAAIKAIKLAKETGFWDVEFANEYANVPVAVWMTGVSGAFQHMLTDIIAHVSLPTIEWLRDQYLAPLIQSMNELTCLFSEE